MTLFLIVRWKNIAITLSTKSLILLRRGHLCNLLNSFARLQHRTRYAQRVLDRKTSRNPPEIPRFPIRPLSRPISFQKRCLFINTFDSIDIVSSLLRDKGMREKNPRDGINEIRLIKGAAVLSEGEDCGSLLRTVSSFNSL